VIVPIYVYKCRKCGHVVEEIQKMDDPPPVKCDKCGTKGTMEQTMGVSNFTLAPGGVGWGKDGYSG